MDKMTDSRAVEVLERLRAIAETSCFDVDHIVCADELPALDLAIARLRDPAEAQPTPIGDLLADYEANGCDHTDMAWVRAAARRYVKTMPDSQVRCLLHVLAQESAEAQAQGGVEVVGEVLRIKEGTAVVALFDDSLRVGDNLYTAPPSAPVGVDDELVAGAMEAAADACARHVVCNEAIRAALEYALAAQPGGSDNDC